MTNVEQYIQENILNKYLFEKPDAKMFSELKEDMRRFKTDDFEFTMDNPIIIYNPTENSLNINGELFNETLGEKHGPLDITISPQK